MTSEDELVRQAQAGDTDAFCLLAQAYERRIYSLALHYSRERQDAEDLSQEVWLKAYAALSTFRYESSFGGEPFSTFMQFLWRQSGGQ